MRKRLKCIIEDLNSEIFLNQILFGILGTIDLNLEVKFTDKLFQLNVTIHK